MSDASAPAGQATIVTVDLDEPLQLGDQTIASFQLRKPKAGELRGLSLVQLGQMSVDELTKLLPRITIPPLPAHLIAQIDPADMMEIAGKITDFLLSKAQKAELRTI